MSEIAGANPIEEPTSPVSDGRRYLPAWQKATLYGIAILATLAFFIVLRSPIGQRAENDRPAPVPMVEGGTPWRAPPAQPAPPPPMPVSLPAALPAPPPAMPIPRDDPNRAGRESPITSGSIPSSAQRPATAVTVPTGDSTPVTETALGARLKPTLLRGSKATLLPHPDLTITQGSKIPCIVQEAIDSTQPGLLTCIVPVNIYGTTGRVSLLDRGTRIVGELQSAPAQGQRRVFILWTRAETPQHAIINLNSPGADRLGQAGLEGEVETHFWQRFGGALMLSFVDSGLQAAANLAAASGGGNNYFSSFQSGGQNAAATALNSTINIPPTLHRDQGLPATVFVAADLDFSEVYVVKPGAR